MKSFLFAFVFLIALNSSAQYYYKDIIGTRESSETIKNYRKNKVSRVLLNSYDGENVKDDKFYVEQQFSSASGSLTTTTHTETSDESILRTFADANGNVMRTIDSNNLLVSETHFVYNAAGQLQSVWSQSADSGRTSLELEEHLWEWKGDQPTRMLRIKNKVDTSIINFKLDEAGNVSEEQEIVKGKFKQPYLYYYNAKNQLTDIVRYSPRAKQLMAEYMFEYSPSSQVIQKITVPSNTNDYYIWRYQYNAQGLKTREAVYSKYDKKVPMGKIEYVYSFGL
jgi:hypothetical protein